MSQHRIVVGVDGSATSGRALAWAYEEARLRSADLEVMMTWEMATVAPDAAFSPPIADLEGAATATIEAMVQSVIGDPGAAGVAVIPTVLMAQPAGALIDASTDADLLVVGSRGRNTFAGLVLGSVSQQCVSHATCAIAVIPPVAQLDTPPDEPVALMPAGQVVVGVDGSVGSEEALRWALDEARRREAPLVAVLSRSHPAPPGEDGMVETSADLDASLARAAVEQIVTGLISADDAVKTRTEVTFEAPAEALHNACGPNDVLVVGARGFGGFKGLLLGSVSLQTVQHAPCPVVIVRPHGTR